MICRKGCGACCIAISISSPMPGMPNGKKAGERCPHLSIDFSCTIHGTAAYPKVCANLTPSIEMCGSTYAEAYAYLEKLERLTAPGTPSAGADELFRGFTVESADAFFKRLMTSFVLSVNGTVYRLHELELYYFHSNDHPDGSVYRREKNAGDIFFHEYGVDICFQTRRDGDVTSYGGVLIRSIRTDGGTMICGPANCRQELLNRIARTGGEQTISFRLDASPAVSQPELYKCERTVGATTAKDFALAGYRFITGEFIAFISGKDASGYYRSLFKDTVFKLL